MDSISSVSRNAMISSWNNARRLELIEKPSDVDEDEEKLIQLELLIIEEPDEQQVKVSDDDNEPLTPNH